jgi:hypothetical protein
MACNRLKLSLRGFQQSTLVHYHNIITLKPLKEAIYPKAIIHLTAPYKAQCMHWGLTRLRGKK